MCSFLTLSACLLLTLENDFAVENLHFSILFSKDYKEADGGDEFRLVSIRFIVVPNRFLSRCHMKGC